MAASRACSRSCRSSHSARSSSNAVSRACKLASRSSKLGLADLQSCFALDERFLANLREFLGANFGRLLRARQAPARGVQRRRPARRVPAAARRATAGRSATWHPGRPLAPPVHFARRSNSLCSDCKRSASWAACSRSCSNECSTPTHDRGRLRFDRRADELRRATFRSRGALRRGSLACGWSMRISPLEKPASDE